MIRFLLREKNVTSQEILSEISLFVKNPLALRAMLSMSFRAVPGPLQFFAHSFNNITGVQKHTEVLPVDSQGQVFRALNKIFIYPFYFKRISD